MGIAGYVSALEDIEKELENLLNRLSELRQTLVDVSKRVAEELLRWETLHGDHFIYRTLELYGILGKIYPELINLVSTLKRLVETLQGIKATAPECTEGSNFYYCDRALTLMRKLHDLLPRIEEESRSLEQTVKTMEEIVSRRLPPEHSEETMRRTGFRSS